MKDLFEIINNFDKCHVKSILKWGSPAREKKNVSILIPVYKNFEFFKRALASAINQSYDGDYSIIIEDNNYDGDLNNVNMYEKYIREVNLKKISYFKNAENVGPINNYNLAIQNSNSEYFVICHEDDELSEDCLESLITFQKEFQITTGLILPYNIFINSSSEIINAPLRQRRKFFRLRLWDFFLSSPSNGAGCLINRDAIYKIGGFNPDYYPSADYGMLSLYVHKYGGYRLNNRAYYKYRFSDKNASIKLFYTCIERDEFYRNCMKKKIAIPNFILNRIIRANKSCHTERTERLWLHEVIHPASFAEKLVMVIVVKISNLIHKVFG